MDKSWSVIKFPDENAVEAVPTRWLRGNYCFWPPWSQDRINKAIKNCQSPDAETWKRHPYTSLRNNVFADYEHARKKMEKATVSSDLDSQTDSHSDTGCRKKRKLMKTTFTKFTSFELSGAESDDDAGSILPAPPKYKGIEKKKVSVFENENDGHENVQLVMAAATTLANSRNSPALSETSASSVSGTENAYFDDNIQNKEKTPTTTQGRKNDNVATVVTQVGVPSISELQQITGCLKQIIRKQNIIQSTLSDLGEDINEIKNRAQKDAIIVVDDKMSIFTILHLPVDNAADLQSLEEYLSVDEQMNSAVREVAICGGKNTYDLIYRATQKLVTNKFASSYSYFGRQKKSKFSSLKLNELLKRVACNSFPNSSEKEAEVAVAKWLRRCTERAKKEQH